jgi:hypothetical protein
MGTDNFVIDQDEWATRNPSKLRVMGWLEISLLVCVLLQLPFGLVPAFDAGVLLRAHLLRDLSQS